MREIWHHDEHFEVSLEPVTPPGLRTGVLVHITNIDKLSLSMAKKLKQLLPVLEEMMALRGHRHILMYNPAQTSAWKRFIEKFIGYRVLFPLENGHVVYGKRVS